MPFRLSELINIYKKVRFIPPYTSKFLKEIILDFFNDNKPTIPPVGIPVGDFVNYHFLWESFLYLVRSIDFFLAYKWAMKGLHRIPGFQDRYYGRFFICTAFLRLSGFATLYINKEFIQRSLPLGKDEEKNLLKMYKGTYEIERKMRNPKEIVLYKKKIKHAHEYTLRKFSQRFNKFYCEISDQGYEYEFFISNEWSTSSSIKRNALTYDITELSGDITHFASYEHAKIIAERNFFTGEQFGPEGELDEDFIAFGIQEKEIGEYIECLLRILAEIGKKSPYKHNFRKEFQRISDHIGSVESSPDMEQHFQLILEDIINYLS